MKIKQLDARVKKAEKNGAIKFNIHHSTGSEGVWAYFVSPQDKIIYEEDKAGKTYDVFMANHALVGRPSWGAKITLKTTGSDNRPKISAQDLIKQIEDAVKDGTYPETSEFENAS